MSLFSENIIEDPWVGMAYAFWNCTNPLYESDIWESAFKINWSKVEMRKIVSVANHGTTKFSESDWEEVKGVLNEHRISFIPKEYYYIIIMVLIANSLNEETLSQSFTNCLSKKKIREGGSVQVKIRDFQTGFVYLIIHAKTTTPQRIEIILKKR